MESHGSEESNDQRDRVFPPCWPVNGILNGEWHYRFPSSDDYVSGKAVFSTSWSELPAVTDF